MREIYTDILPPAGVYAVRVIYKRKTYDGVANLGVRPSFDEKDCKSQLEVYNLGLNRNLYGQCLEVQFIRRIRSEKCFNRPQDLIRQIQLDITRAKLIFSS